MRKLKIALDTAKLTRINTTAAQSIFGPESPRAEVITRQYLLAGIVNKAEFNTRLLAAASDGGAYSGALPAEWRSVVERHGFHVDRVRSAYNWWRYVLLLWAYGVASVLKTIAIGSWRCIGGLAPDTTRYVFFDSLSAHNLPRPGEVERSRDILSWYAGWSGRASDAQLLAHSVIGHEQLTLGPYRAAYVRDAVPPLTDGRALKAYVQWAVRAVAFATGDLLRGRWWNAILLAEAGKRMIVTAQAPNRLALQYLFQASWIYRPLWTYEAERKGSEIIFYFYSTNSEGFKRSEGYRELDFDWRSLSWPRYLVWDEFQAAYLRKGVGSAPIVEVVGPIWFQSGGVAVPTASGFAMAVFDVQPFRSSMYQALALDFDYYTPDTCIQFLTDVESVASALSCTVLWKRKRHIGKLAHPRYRAFADTLANHRIFVPVDPSASAHAVVEASDVVVSMPFTSTALIARFLNKPTCYYDPTGMLCKDDLGAHGISVIQGTAELREWVAEHKGETR